MKSTKVIKQELNQTVKTLDRISKEMEEKCITYEEAHNHQYIWPGGKVSTQTYLEILGYFTTVKTTLQFVLR